MRVLHPFEYQDHGVAFNPSYHTVVDEDNNEILRVALYKDENSEPLHARDVMKYLGDLIK
jgi:hypothetical protein